MDQQYGTPLVPTGGLVQVKYVSPQERVYTPLFLPIFNTHMIPLGLE